MGFRGHAWVAILCAIMGILVLKAVYPLSLPQMLGGLVAAVLGGFFPDVDIDSRCRRLFIFLLFGLLIILLVSHQYVSGALLFGLCGMVLVVGHRTLFHNAYFLVALAAFFVYLALTAGGIPTQDALIGGCFFLLGCFSHLCADAHFSG